MPANTLPFYGVEPYNARGVAPATDYGGGADVTQENLLITLWLLNTPGVIADGGELIKPFSVTPAAAPQIAVIGEGATKQAFNSRLSTRVGLNTLVPEGPTSGLLAILQTPNAVREAFLRNGPAEPTGLQIQSSLAIGRVWDFELTDQNMNPIPGGVCVFSNLSDPVPFASTNGADGAFPTFYDDISAGLAAFSVTLNALRGGAPSFTAALITIPDVTPTPVVTLRWPHSLGRG